MRLYRAVSEAEFRRLMRTQRFSPAPNTYEAGRFFALAAADARQWAERLGQRHVVSVEFSAGVIAGMMRWDQMDGIGVALFATWRDLSEVREILEVPNE